MRHNVKTMEKSGYSKKRAEGTAYGEVGMEKKARKDEAKGMKKEDAYKKHEKHLHEKPKAKKMKKDCY